MPSEVDLCAADLESGHAWRITCLASPKGLSRSGDSGRFEIVLIDCPPSLGILTLNAFAASDGLLVPLQCEYYALEGISMMNRILGELQEDSLPGLDIFGVVMTMFDGRTKLSNEVVGEVRNLPRSRVRNRHSAQHEAGRGASFASRSSITINTVPARQRMNCCAGSVQRLEAAQGSAVAFGIQ